MKAPDSSDDVEAATKSPSSAGPASDGHREARPVDIAHYLRGRADEFAAAWASEINARGLGQGNQFDGVVGQFMSRLTHLLPWLVGPHTEYVEPLWTRTAELFGVMSAKRGLAAGEVIDEFQILRELLIRALYHEPPPEGRVSLRDTLHLNRIVDSGVTHASVGHTDAMFFQFFEAPEAHVAKTPEEIVREAEAQLALVEEELESLVGVWQSRTTGSAASN